MSDNEKYTRNDSSSASSLRPSTALSTAVLRQRAEAEYRKKVTQSAEPLESLSPEAMRQMLHELGVYQIELEMQNEELRRSQVALDASRSDYFELYDLAPVGYCTVNQKGQILLSNLTAASMLCIDRSALVKQSITLFILKEHRNLFFLLQKQLAESDEPRSCELRMVKSDGTPFWVYLAVNVVRNEGGAPEVRVMFSDISERKQSELSLLESDKTLRSILDTTLDGFWRVDGAGNLLDVNPTYCKQSGYTREELLGMRINDLDALETAAETAAHIKQIIESEHAQFETIQRRKDGSLWHTEVSATYQDIAGGRFCVFLRDITERKSMQEILINGRTQYKEQAFKLLNAVDGLRSLAADTDAVRENEKKHIARELHDELGQLLAALRLHLGLLNMEYARQLPELAEKTSGMLDILDRALSSMRSIVAHLRPSALDMGLVSALEWLRDDFISMFGIRCILSCNTNTLQLSDNQATIIFRIIQESLTNIAKHAKASIVHINVQANNDLQLLVQDNGIGFDLNARRVDLTCFGLRGMRERVLALGGELKIDTAPGKGCCVILNIPIEGAK